MQTAVFRLVRLLIFLALIAYACTSKSTALVAEKNTTPIAEKTETNTEMIRFPRTKAFAKIPSEYIWEEAQGTYRFGKSESVLRCIYLPVDLAKMKKVWERESARIPTITLDSFQVDNRKVITMEGYLSKEKSQIYFLMMETGYHPLMLMAETKDTSLVAEMDVPGIMASLQHVDNFDLDIFELQDYKFDEDLSGFQYYFSLGTNEKTDYLRNPITDMDNLGPEKITVTPKTKMTEEKIEQSLENAKKTFGKRVVVDFNRQDILVNGLKTSYMEVDYDSEGIPSYKLFAIIRGPEKDYIFRATTNQDVEETKANFLATLKSFELK